MKRRSALSGSVIVIGSLIASQVLRLGRSVVIAWIVSPSDFGIAACFMLVVTMLQLFTDLGFERLIIQADDGEDESLLRTVQTLLLARGLLTALLILALADLLAGPVFQVPETAWGFRCIALVPILQGLKHRDIQIHMRHLHVTPRVICELTPAVVTMLIAWPIATWLGDWRSFLVLTLLATCLETVMTHLIATRPFRFGWDPEQARRCWTFGWPLMTSGVITMFTKQLNRMVIPAFFGVAAMGQFTIAQNVADIPSRGIFKINSSVLMPLLSRSRPRPEEFLRNLRRVIQAGALFSSALAAVFLIAGAPLLGLIYGSKFAEAQIVLPMLGLAVVFLVFQAPLGSAAIAMGDTRSVLLINAFRGIRLIVTGAVLLGGLSWHGIAIGIALSEFVAVLISIWILVRRHDLAPSIFLTPGAMLLAIIATDLLVGQWALPDQTLPSLNRVLAITPPTLVALAIGPGLILGVAPELRSKLVELLRRRSKPSPTSPIAPSDSAGLSTKTPQPVEPMGVRAPAANPSVPAGEP